MLLPLIAQPSQRGTDTALDARLVNGYIEKDASGNVMVCKRGGFFEISVLGDAGVAGQAIYSEGNVDFYYVASNRFRRYSSGTANVYGPVLSGGDFWLNSNLRSPRQVYISNGISAFYFDTATLTVTPIGASHPAVTVPGSAFLDGTMYVMDSSARIYGSNINDLATWSALNFITAQIEPDPGVAIAKQLIYVVAFKQASTEFFYDAGNPTGSPLLPVQNAKIPYGCAVPMSVVDIAGDLYLISSTNTQRYRIMRLSGLKPSFVSTPEIERYLNESLFGDTYGWACTFAGHTFYCVSTPFRTLAFDVDLGVWAIWETASGGRLPFVASAGRATTETQTLLLSRNSGRVFQGISASYYSDYETAIDTAPTPINFEVVTPNFDGGTRNIKVLSKMRFMCDQNSTGTLEVCWSDDDYKTWSSWRSVNLQDPQPQLTDLGSFYQRAFWFRSSSPGPLRIRAVDLDLLEGSA